MKKLITLTAALGLFVCVSVKAQDNAKPAAAPQATEAAVAVPAATASKDDQATTKKDEKACKNKSASCCKDQERSKWKVMLQKQG